MLSTLSAFLPSALSDRLDKSDVRSDDLSFDNHQQQQVVKDEVVKQIDMVGESNKKEKKKKSSSNETFIVVRPPPAKSNHPLNLQLQLVPAHHSRDRSNTSTIATPTTTRASTDLGLGNDTTRPSSSPSASESEHGVKRTPSIRSNRSDTSGFYASSAAVSTGSVTSFASTASTASGRRMIIPLYNLSAHNVMTNTILDAGTDARVAKFNKRGLELIDLAILEPTEVWGSKDHLHGAGSDSLDVPICRSCSGNSSLAPPGRNGSRAGTPDPTRPHSPGSSRLSVASDPSSVAGDHSAGDSVITPTATPTGTKKLFGKLFRKKEGSGGGQQSSSMTGTRDRTSSPKTLASLQDSRPGVSSKPSKHQAPSEVLLPAVLGLSPILSAATNPPTGRCVSYVWTVRKWLKVDNQGRISGVLGKIGKEASAHGIGNSHFLDGGDWEVRFEWARGKSKGEKARRGRRQTGTDVGVRNCSHTSCRRHSAVSGSEDAPEQLYTKGGLAISVESPRQSLDVRRSTSRAPSPRADAPQDVSAMSANNHSEDDNGRGHVEDGDESDPEDSETPWICSMILSHSSTPRTQVASVFTKGQTRIRSISSGDIQHPPTPTPDNIHTFASESGHVSARPTPIRFKVGTLSPAPHHPKVVCQLKIPFPLPDAEVASGLLRKRLVLADGSTRSTVPMNRTPGMQSLTMSAEEIKDVVCSTAFWIIVREGFGGVGKKSRKGDGWKIRG